MISRYAHEISIIPAWVEWLTWTRLWPLNREEERARIVLPLLPRWHQIDVRLRQLRDATTLLLPVALLVMLVRPDGLLDTAAGWAAVLALVLHLLAAGLGLLLTVDIRADTTGEWVRLSGVHRDFVTAVETQLTRPNTPPLLVAPPEAEATAPVPPARTPREAGGEAGA